MGSGDAAIAPACHAIVTGGSSGIGIAAAKLLAARGMHLSIIARDPRRLSTARQEIEVCRRDPAQRVLALSADVAVRPGIEAAIDAATAELGLPTLVLACAGIARAGYFLDLPPEEFERLVAVNYLGSVWTARAVVPAMSRAGGGRIVLFSSAAGLLGIYGYSAYSPTKFALRGFAEVLRAELKSSKIGVSIIYPPDTETPGFREEERSKPAETRRISAAAKRMTADAVARATIEGIDRGAFAITPGRMTSLLHHATNPLQRILSWHLDRMSHAAGRSDKL